MSQDVTSERLQELLKTFTPDQLAYIAERPFVRYDYEAAQKIGLARETVGRWENKADIDEAVTLMALDGVLTAQEILRRHVTRAAQEISDELDHRQVTVRHRAAVEILDRNLGKAGQKVDLTTGGEKIKGFVGWSPENWEDAEE